MERKTASGTTGWGSGSIGWWQGGRRRRTRGLYYYYYYYYYYYKAKVSPYQGNTKQQEDLRVVGENATNQSTLVVLHDSRKKIRAKASFFTSLTRRTFEY
jgi:hypothetical protein